MRRFGEMFLSLPVCCNYFFLLLLLPILLFITKMCFILKINHFVCFFNIVLRILILKLEAEQVFFLSCPTKHNSSLLKVFSIFLCSSIVFAFSYSQLTPSFSQSSSSIWGVAHSEYWPLVSPPSEFCIPFWKLKSDNLRSKKKWGEKRKKKREEMTRANKAWKNCSNNSKLQTLPSSILLKKALFSAIEILPHWRG